MAAEEVLHCIDEALVQDLTCEMVRMQTTNPPGDELPLAEMLRNRISGLDIEARLLALGENRANLICRISGSGERPSMVLCGHLDTVLLGNEPWEHPPLSGIKADGRIFGRGSSDMKGGVAAMVAALVAIRRSGLRLRGDLVLALTAGEEVDCLGARSMVEGRLLEGAGCLVIAEPTDMDVYIAQKGALWLEAITYGKAAHGSLPHQGTNAILPMADFVQKAVNALGPSVRHSHLGQPSINIGTIQGGSGTNIVPDCCKLTIDLRTLPGQDHQHLYVMLRDLLEESAKAAGAKSESESLPAAPSWILRPMILSWNSLQKPPVKSSEPGPTSAVPPILPMAPSSFPSSRFRWLSADQEKPLWHIRPMNPSRSTICARPPVSMPSPPPASWEPGRVAHYR